MDKIKSLTKNYILFVKQIFISPLNICLIFLFPLLIIFVPIIFIPYKFSSGIVYTLSVIPIMGAVYYQTNLQINNSVLRKNFDLGGSSKNIYYLSTLLTMCTVAVFVATITYFMLSAAWTLGVLKSGWFSYNESEITMGIAFFVLIQYYAIIVASILFSISFAMQKFMKNQNVYFTFIFSVVIIGIIFGGAFNDYFGSYLNDNGQAYLGMQWENSPSLFPESFYFVSIFYPFYAPSAIITEMTTQLCDYHTSLYESSIVFLDGSQWNIFKLFIPEYTDATFTLTVWIPYIYIFCGFIIGKTISKYYH